MLEGFRAKQADVLRAKHAQRQFPGTLESKTCTAAALRDPAKSKRHQGGAQTCGRSGNGAASARRAGQPQDLAQHCTAGRDVEGFDACASSAHGRPGPPGLPAPAPPTGPAQCRPHLPLASRWVGLPLLPRLLLTSPPPLLRPDPSHPAAGAAAGGGAARAAHLRRSHWSQPGAAAAWRRRRWAGSLRHPRNPPALLRVYRSAWACPFSVQRRQSPWAA